MSNVEVYDNCFRSALMLGSQEDVRSLSYQGVESWDSVGHMTLVAALEDAFGVALEMDDIIDFESYEVGIATLKRYGVDF